MARRLIWAPRAVDDLEEIAEYIAHDSPAYARAVSRRVFERAESLTEQPRQGRRVPEYDGSNELREVFIHSWRLIYSVTSEEVQIVAIVHGARLLANVGPIEP